MSGPAELGVITINRAASIQSWNHWLASATGLAESEVRGRSLTLLVPPARRDVIAAFIEEVLTTGTTRVLAPAFHRYLIACPPREPSRHFGEMQQFVTIAPLVAAGEISGAMITVEDVTSQLEQQRDLASRIEAAAGESTAGTIEAVGAGDWQLRGVAVRNLRQRASTAEIAHLLDTLRRGYQDLNVVSSALQVLSANRDVTTPLIELLSDPQPDLRMHAALALGNVRDAAAVPALVGLLADDEPNVRFHAIEALGGIGAGEAVEPLSAIARSGDFFLAFPAIEALAKADDPRVGPALVSLLGDDLLRPAAIGALTSIGDEEAVSPLVQVLNSQPDVETVSAIASALDRIRSREEDAFGAGNHIVDIARSILTPAGVAALSSAVTQRRAPLESLIAVLGWSGRAALPALVNAVGLPEVEDAVSAALRSIGSDAVEPLIARLSDGDRQARLAVVPILGRLNDERAVAPLIAQLDGADAELTAAAAAAIASLGDAAALEPLLGLLAHEHAMVRQAAIAAINSIGAAGTSARIRARIDDPDARARASAIRVAGYFGFDECVPGVFRALDDPDEDVRRAAIEQLPLFDDHSAQTRLIKALREEVPRNRAAAAHTMRHVQAAAVAAPLADALDDEDAWVRYFACGAVAQRRDADAVPALSRLAHSDSAPHVRIAALQALAAIDPFVAGEISVPLVGDSDPEVASAALAAVAAGSHPHADRLLEDAVKSGDVFLRRAAVNALPARSTVKSAELLAWAGRLVEPPDLAALAVAALCRIAAADDSAARRAAVVALLELAAAPDTRANALPALGALSETVVEDLRVSLNSPRSATRLVAVEALARLRHPKASEALAAALRDEDAAVRRAAIVAFGRLGTKTIGAEVAAISRTDPDLDVRRVAAAMCRRHGWQVGRTR